MAKYYGTIGYAIDEKIKPGLWEKKITERKYYGELTKSSYRMQTADKVNDNLTFSNTISIISDPFANNNFKAMVYVEFQGTKWKITNVEISYPRLILTIGGVYNDQELG